MRFLLWPHVVVLQLCKKLCFQVKGLLKERKVDLLVDPDLKQNYDQREVEELIQVSLLL